ncbi:hypothetical protein PS6_002366 [Mucor atramentarius]
MDSDLFAKLFGYFSIGCWIVVFTPQLYENYTRKNTDGVSIQFLSFWILGDILNLFGIILENLLFTMLLLALYYLFADCLLMGQVVYYRTVYPQRHIEEVVVNDYGAGGSDLVLPHPRRRSSSCTSSSSSSSSSNASSHISGLSHHNEYINEHTSLLPTKINSKSQTSSTTIQQQSSRTRTIVRLFFASSIASWTGLMIASALFFFGPGQHKVDMSQWHLIPQLLGWGSAILYCVSRIPQIMQNFRNESVEGLSLPMFVFSVVGNVTYCVSPQIQPICLLTCHG